MGDAGRCPICGRMFPTRSYASRELRMLAWLADNPYSWGGHLMRGEPCSDPVMQNWVDRGWIEPTASPSGRKGYVITEAGRRALKGGGDGEG